MTFSKLLLDDVSFLECFVEGGLCHRGVLVRAGVVERHGLGLQQVLVPAETGSVT